MKMLADTKIYGSLHPVDLSENIFLRFYINPFCKYNIYDQYVTHINLETFSKVSSVG